MWSLWAWTRRIRELVSAVFIYRMIGESSLWWLQYFGIISEAATWAVLSKNVLRSFTKFTGKHLWLNPAALIKTFSSIGIFLWILKVYCML